MLGNVSGFKCTPLSAALAELWSSVCPEKELMRRKVLEDSSSLEKVL